MKKILLLVLFCVALSTCITSCSIALTIEPACTKPIETETAGTEPVETEPIKSEDPYTFSSVNSLVVAIKKKPHEYINKEITVFGTIVHSKEHYTGICDADSTEYLSNESGFDVQEYRRYRSWKEDNKGIDIIIGDKLLYACAESGDYVELCGTVIISNGELYLDNCEYEIIRLASER
jgi:hypothetical protein